MPNDEPAALDAARARAADAAATTEALRAELVSLNKRSKPARAAIRARDEASAAVAELRTADVRRGADAMGRGQKAPKTDPAIAGGEAALAAAERDAAAGEMLLAKLRMQAEAIRSRMVEAEAEQQDAAAALARAGAASAAAEFNAAVEALGPLLTRMDVAYDVAARLRIALPAMTDPVALRRTLREEGLRLAAPGAAGRARPEWLDRRDREGIAKGAEALLAQAGLPADLHIPIRHETVFAPDRIDRPTVTVSAAEPPHSPPPHPTRQPRQLDFHAGARASK